MATLANTVGRAAAILTNSEVFGTSLDLQVVSNGCEVVVDLDFTIGSLTNMIVVMYGSADDTTFKPIRMGATAVTETLTASGTRLYALDIPGVRYFKPGVVGTGTVTASSCAFTYRYIPYMTTAHSDGITRIS